MMNPGARCKVVYSWGTGRRRRRDEKEPGNSTAIWRPVELAHSEESQAAAQPLDCWMKRWSRLKSKGLRPAKKKRTRNRWRRPFLSFLQLKGSIGHSVCLLFSPIPDAAAGQIRSERCHIDCRARYIYVTPSEQKNYRPKVVGILSTLNKNPINIHSTRMYRSWQSSCNYSVFLSLFYIQSFKILAYYIRIYMCRSIK